MRKRLLLALMALILAICLTGCNLFGVNPQKRADREVARIEEDYAAVMAEYDGGEVTAMDIMYEFSTSYSSMLQYYPYLGLEVTEEDILQLRNDSLDSKIERLAHVAEAERRGISLTEDELAEIDSTVEETMQSETELFMESVAGSNEEEREAETRIAMTSYGFLEPNVHAYATEMKLVEKVEEAARAEVAEPTQEEIEAYYQEKVAEDEELYQDSPGSYEGDQTSADSVIAWNPEGYRTVKHILIIPEEDVLNPVLDKRDEITGFEEELESLQEDLDALEDDDPTETYETDKAMMESDIQSVQERIEQAKEELAALETACLDSVRDKLEEIDTRLLQGEDFDTLIAEYGEDPGMQSEPCATRGYYVSAESTNWDTVFRDAAMLLENVGDVSAPVIGSSGIHIIRYESDVTPGAVPLEEIADQLEEQALDQAQTEHYEAAVEEWVAAMNVTYHYDAWNPIEG